MAAGCFCRRRPDGYPGMKSRLAAHPVLFECLFVLQGYAEFQPMGAIQDLFFYLAVVSGAIFILQLGLASFVRHPRKPAILARITAICPTSCPRRPARF